MSLISVYILNLKIDRNLGNHLLHSHVRRDNWDSMAGKSQGHTPSSWQSKGKIHGSSTPEGADLQLGQDPLLT